MEENLSSEGGETLDQLTHKVGCPIPGSAQGQFGQGFEPPDPMEDVPSYSRGSDYMIVKGPC